VTEEPESEAIATIGLAQRAVDAPLSGVAEFRVFAVAGGAVYGLEASQGKVLWRRDVGFEANVQGPQFPPTPVSERPGADPLLVSRARQEVLRVEASTGKIRWRFPVGEAFDAHPVVFDGRVLVAARSGRLLSLDLETGNSAEYIELPQPLRVGPSADDGRNLIFQVGEHSSLFLLSASDGSCKDVIYLGHEPGSIIVPPVRVSRFLLVCENDGVRDSVVKVLDIDPPASDDGETPPLQVVQQVRLKGHVYTTPIVSGTQVVIVTDAGEITVLGLTDMKGKAPLSLSAEGKTASDDSTDLVRFASMGKGRIWIADSQLTQYAVRASESRLKSSWFANEGSVSLQPPMIAGNAVIQVRQRRGMPGVVVSAMGMAKGEVQWETTLASPAAGTPVADGTTRTLIATTAVGGVFQVQPPDDGQVAIRDDPAGAVPSAELSAPISQVFQFLPSGLIAMIPGGDPIDVPVFEPGKSPAEARLRNVALTSPLSGQAIAFAGGLLAPCQEGQVFLLDPRTGVEIAKPFQPQLEAGQKYRWSRPAPKGNDQFVIADDSGGLYCVDVKSDPTKHLAEHATIRLDDPVVSPVAVLGDRMYAVDRADSLVRVDLPDLTDKTQQSLGAKCVLGPVTVGDSVLLVTNDELMHVIDASGKMRSDSLPHGVPTAPPLVDGAQWLLASPAGTVWRVDPATGEELGRLDTGLALGSGLAAFGNRLLVAGHDGTLYLIAKP
jgi:outer membrane protein assembly factor BamB